MPFKNASDRKKYQQAWHVRNAAAINAKDRAWRKANRGKVNQQLRRRREKLTDGYVAQLLTAGTAIKKHHLSKVLLETKRTVLQIKRLCQSQKI